MKRILAFDIDQTLNVAKTPITDDIADLLIGCLDHFEICPISGQKFDQFLIQIVNRLEDRGVTPEQLSHLHLFIAQGTQYYRYDLAKKDWVQVYNYPLTDEQVAKITETIETSAKELGFWEEDKLQKATKSSKIASPKSPSRLSANTPAPKPNTPGIPTAKNVKKSSLAVRNSPPNLTTKSAAPPLLTLSPLA